MRLNLLLLVFGFLVLPLYGASQVKSNDWIKPDQEYFKVQVAEMGVYKVTYEALNQEASADLSQVDPEHFQLFRMGEEKPINVQTGGDNAFGKGDYIEFYGEKNDGTLDSGLYQDPEDQPHSYASMYTDSASYFLTWQEGAQGKRYRSIKKTNYSNYNKEDYFIKEKVELTNNQFQFELDYLSGFPNIENSGIFDNSQYTAGEGWGNLYTRFVWRKYQINTNNYYKPGPPPEAEFLLFGAQKNGSYRPGNGEVYNHQTYVRVDGGTDNFNFLHKSFQYAKKSKTIKKKAFTNKKTEFYLEHRRPGGIERAPSNIYYIKAQYPKTFNVENDLPFNFSLNKKNTGFYHIEFPNFPSGIKKPIIFDKANERIIRGTFNGNGQFLALIPAKEGKQNLFLTARNEAETVKPIKVKSNNYRKEFSGNPEYLIITHKKLKSSAKQYANYRNKDYNVKTVYIDNLYNHYSYGTHHPLAIRYFLKDLTNQSQLPEYILLLGKGLENKHVRRAELINQDLVPSIGVPPSDNLYVHNLKNNDPSKINIPAAVGRVPAENNQKALNYLNKLKTYEKEITLKGESGGLAWQKNFMHIAGGNEKGINNQIKSYLRSSADIARDTNLGGNIFNLSKSKSFPVDKTLKDAFIKKVNKGLKLVNYFGHGAAEVLEVDIGQPQEYTQNKGNYPIFFFSGCILGNTYSPKPVKADRFILSEKGGIAWLAETHFSFINYLRPYANNFYKNMAYKNYGNNLGDVVLGTIQDFKHNGGNNSYHIRNENQILQKTLQGDPALKLYSPNKPDYSTSKANVDFIPTKPNASLDSVGLRITVDNLGRSIRDSVALKIQHTRPDFSQKTYDSIWMKAPFYKDTISFYLKTNQNFSGNNEFQITLDPNNEIAEITQTNNQATIQKIFPSNNAKPIFPKEYGIVPIPNVTLKAQSNNFSGNQQTFYFEIDTVPSFSSPYLKKSGAIQGKSLGKWSNRLLNQDSTVYYWRVKVDDEDATWASSSFMMIKNSPKGWAQGEYKQMTGIQAKEMTLDTAKRQLNFNRQVQGRYKASVSAAGVGYRYEDENSRLMFRSDSDDGVFVLAIEPNKVERFYYSSPYNKDNAVARNDGHDEKYSGIFNFDWTKKNGNIDTAVLEDFLNHLDTIPEGYRVLLASRSDHQFANLGEQVYQKLNNLGSGDIRKIKNNWFYILKGRKGAESGEAVEFFPDTNISAPPESQSLRATMQMSPLKVAGSILSEKIGPSQFWQTATVNIDPREKPSEDSVVFSIIGIDKNGENETLRKGLETGTHIINNINAKRYPFLRLKVEFYDSSSFTPAKLNNWIVLYESLPEGIVNDDIAFKFHNDTLQQGENLRFKTAYQNISEYPMDSVLWQNQILDDNQKKVYNVKTRKKPLTPGDSIFTDIVFATDSLAGKYTFKSTVNPNQDQPEEYFFNNSFTTNFYVKEDKTDPVLDVTFNGRHIKDREIVSPKPKIRITAKDDNEYFLLNDTSYIKVYLTNPQGVEKQLSYGKDLEFYPAKSSQENKATIIHQPEEKLANGTYELRVRAEDESGNQSGVKSYQKRFRVVNQTKITNFYPYPNPLTKKMRFIFTITGEQVPDEMNVQIMTIRGKVIKELTKEDLGPLKLGLNRTNFIWQGRNQLGRPVENGIYLYRVQAYMDGEPIDFAETDGKDFANQKVGKLHLMR